MNKRSMSKTYYRVFNVGDIYRTAEIDNGSDIFSTDSDETDTFVDNENSVNFFIGKWVLLIY